MRCSDARRKLSALLDRAGEPDLRRQVAKHVGECGGCRAELEALAGVDRSLSEALDGDPPPHLLDGFWPRLAARLGADDAHPELDDMKALAARTMERAAVSAPVEEDLLHAPAALGQVVLPVPAAPARKRRWPVVAGALATVAVAVIAFVATRPSPEPAAERVPLTPPPAPTVTPAPAATAPPPEPALAPEPSPPPPAPAATTTAPKKSRPAETEAPKPATAPAPASASASREPPKPTKPEKTADEILDIVSKPAEPPPPAAPKVGVEKLSHEQIKAGMAAVEAAVQRCYDQNKVAGQAMVNVKIDAAGKVTAVTVTGAFAGTPTGACVSKAVEGAHFDAFDGPPMNIKYQFKLEEVE